MKTPIAPLLALVALAAAPRPASGQSAAHPGDPAAPPDLFGLIGADYKKPQELPETFFNPFKVQPGGAGAAIQKKDGAALTNEAIAEAVAHRGVSGILYAAPGSANGVIIGDQVFEVGEELAFPDGDKGGCVPLVAGATTVLREIGTGDLSLDVTPDGEATRRVGFSLRNFWRP